MPTDAIRAVPWRRLRTALVCALVVTLPLTLVWDSVWPLWSAAALLATAGTLAFSLLERWPRRLPPRVARWALQVAGVALAMPLTVLAIYLLRTPVDAPPFWMDAERRSGFFLLCFFGTLVAPWLALAALVRQKDALARTQALAFELERSELARQALDARLHLMQAQVAPHFLFNTLANVQALVDTGSPQAPALLRSLTAYLRAAVPRLHDAPGGTLGQELELVRAYLELMRMRMPDRLAFTLQSDPALHDVGCPALILLTLVENAVRHGIDPAEEGGSIDVSVYRRGDDCVASVRDTGVGMGAGSGTGLATLRERLALQFGGRAHLRLYAVVPHGVCAEIEFPMGA
jgi:Histidine kinase